MNLLLITHHSTQNHLPSSASGLPLWSPYTPTDPDDLKTLINLAYRPLLAIPELPLLLLKDNGPTYPFDSNHGGPSDSDLAIMAKNQKVS